jgi:hypothetical protein
LADESVSGAVIVSGVLLVERDGSAEIGGGREEGNEEQQRDRAESTRKGRNDDGCLPETAHSHTDHLWL